MGFGVWGLGFGVWGLGFGVHLHVGGALALEFEHKESTVMAGSDEVNLRMRGKDPKAVLSPASKARHTSHVTRHTSRMRQHL